MVAFVVVVQEVVAVAVVVVVLVMYSVASLMFSEPYSSE